MTAPRVIAKLRGLIHPDRVLDLASNKLPREVQASCDRSSLQRVFSHVLTLQTRAVSAYFGNAVDAIQGASKIAAFESIVWAGKTAPI